MATLFTNPRVFAIQSDGTTYPGMQAFFYRAGTLTDQAVYQDSDLTIPHPQPVVADDQGSLPPIYLGSTDYRVILRTASLSVISDTDNYTAAAISAEEVRALMYPRTTSELSNGINPTDLSRLSSPVIDMSRYGILSFGQDNTAIVQSVFNMLKVTGGTMSFPRGDWAFYLDISGTTNAPVQIVGNGSTFRPFSATPTRSTIVYGDNTLGTNQFTGSNVTFRGCRFTAKRFSGAVSTGDLDYAVWLRGTSAKFYDCEFEFGRVAGFCGFYSQYTQFWSCGFYSCTVNATSAGCLLDSASLAASSNEVNFNRCQFFVNKNSLWLKGCLTTRIRDCTFQGNPAGGTGAIVLDADSTGQGTVGTIIDGNWFEVNQTPHIREILGQSTRIVNNSFYTSAGINEVTFTNCYDLKMADNHTYNTITCTINHPSGNSDTAQLYFHGNNWTPALSLAHSGPTILDIFYEGSFTATLAGCTTSPTGTVNYKINGNLVTLYLPTITGTSNATSCSLSGLPVLIRPTADRYIPGHSVDDGTGYASLTNVNTAGAIVLRRDYTGTGFTGSGTKGINEHSLTYFL